MAEEEKQEGGNAGSKKLIIILVAVVVLLLAALGAAVFFLLGSSDAPEQEAQPQEVRKEAIYVPLRTLGGQPAFITNFDDPKHRNRFLQVYAEALTRDSAVAEDLKKHMPLVVHELGQLFARQKFVDLQTTAGKERLRQEATKVVQDILQRETGRPGIEDVFFTNFVMQ